MIKDLIKKFIKSFTLLKEDKKFSSTLLIRESNSLKSSLINYYSKTVNPEKFVYKEFLNYKLNVEKFSRNLNGLIIKVKKLNDKFISGELSKEGIKTYKLLFKKLKKASAFINSKYFSAEFYLTLNYNYFTVKSSSLKFLKSLKENNLDLVLIKRHRETDWCEYYSGKIYSISGKDKTFPPLISIPNGGIPMHSNCKHRYGLVTKRMLKIKNKFLIDSTFLNNKWKKDNKIPINTKNQKKEFQLNLDKL